MNKPSFNPDIRELLIGKKEQKKIKIYPLSLKDQFEMSELLSSLFVEISTVPQAASIEEQNTTFVLGIFNAIKSNIELFLSMVTDADATYVPEFMTNNQLVELAKMVYEMNYEGISKNVKDLVKMVKNPQILTGSSPKSSQEPLTESSIFMDEVTETVE